MRFVSFNYIDQFPRAGVLLGGAVMVVLMAHSLAALRNGEGDHCLQHLHHPHLCLLHGAGWAHEGWAVLMVAGVLLFGLVEAVRHGRAALRAVRSLRELESSAQEHAGPGLPLLRIKSDTPFCMVAGIRRPRVFISSGAERLLNESEHQAVLAHEAAHAQQGDHRQMVGFDVPADGEGIDGDVGRGQHVIDRGTQPGEIGGEQQGLARRPAQRAGRLQSGRPAAVP